MSGIPDDYLSATRLNMFTRCGMQYYFRYCEGLIAPPSGVLSLGSSFHTAIEHNYDQKRQTQTDLKIDEVLDVFSDDFAERVHETAWYEGEIPHVFKDQGVGLLREYQKVISPDVQPKSVEGEFSIPFENKDWTFTGRADLIDNDDVLIENKTIRATPPRPQSDHMLQAIGYVTGFRSTGAREKSARIVYAVKNNIPKMVSYPFVVQNSQIEFFLGQVARVAHMIEAEMFIPNRNQYLCSHRFCGYASRCEQECKGIVPER
jgi:hypothetical protein